MTVNTLLQGGLYTMGCLHVLSSVAGCFTLPLSKASQLIEQWVASSSFWASVGWCWLVGCEGDRKGECWFPYNIMTKIAAGGWAGHRGWGGGYHWR